MPLSDEVARASNPPHPFPKSTIQVLAFFNLHREGQCSDVARITGLSCKTARRRLSQLVEEGILDMMSTKTFPRVHRFRLLDSSAEAARHAFCLLQDLENHGSSSCDSSLVVESDKGAESRLTDAK